MYCRVALLDARPGDLTYHFDAERLPLLSPGDCVKVRLRGRLTTGIVTGIESESPVPEALPLEQVVEPRLVGDDLIELAGSIAREHWSSLGEVLALALPRGVCGYRPRGKAEPVLAGWSGPGAVGLPDSAELAPIDFSRFGVWCSLRTEARAELVAAYAQAAREHGAVLVLLPESRLGDWLPRFRTWFGTALVEYHSGIGRAEQKRTWRGIRAGAHGIIVGSRSVVFAPAARLGGIAVVDEHESAYKEKRFPRISACRVATARARIVDRPVLVSDPTPTVETWFALRTGAYRQVGPQPVVGTRRSCFVVDMRLHRDATISPRLRRELGRAVEDGIAILYVNRLGFSHHVACRECGLVLECPDCRVSMGLTGRALVCRYCGRQSLAIEACPRCGGTSFRFRVPGLELVAREVERCLPRAKVVRCTADSAGGIATGPGVVVVGTRAVLLRPWPESTRLAAAVAFDQDLDRPDFRSRERAFQTLFQMECRASRLGARLVVQTCRPEDPAVSLAVARDLTGFMTKELELRSELGFPPLRELTLLEFSGRSTTELGIIVGRALELLNAHPGVEATGPARVKHGRNPAFAVMVKTPPGQSLATMVDRDLLEIRGTAVRVDVNPLEVS